MSDAVRTGMRAACVAALVLGVMTTEGCRQPRDTGDSMPPARAADATAGAVTTRRGIVRAVGVASESLLVLAAVEGEPPMFVLRGPALPLLRRVAGLEVNVRGRLTGARDFAAGPQGAAVFSAEGFVVRAADGIAAHDGVLVARDGGWLLALADGGERPLAGLPAALRTQVGARVFLVGPLDRPVTTYGIIVPAR